jgi:4-amino-4-deoxy-L-arabinose transferase-like glycosyltransferase
LPFRSSIARVGERFASRPVLRFALLWLLLFSAVIAAHWPLLHLPYYWDEAGYYIPAAFDFFRTGTVIPFSTLTNAHPPGLSVYLAAAWKLFGFRPFVSRVSMCAAAALSLTAVYRLAADQLRSRVAAWAGVLLVACYPVWFTQSSLAQADTLAAAGTLWGLVFALRRPAAYKRAAACFILAALTKEIAIVTPLALAGWEGFLLLRRRGAPQSARNGLRAAGWLCLPVLPLALWFSYHRWRTGFTFGNPQYLRYNAAATLEPGRIALALAQRTLHLTAHLNLFVPVMLALGSLLLPRLPGRARLERGVVAQFWVILITNGIVFSVLGGALLTRYLLPMYPLVLLLTVAAVSARFRWWAWFPALGAAAFVLALLLPPPYRIAPEDTLAYRNAIELEQGAIDYVQKNYPDSTVLTAWPVSDGLRKPELGYVTRAMAVTPIDNFALPTLLNFSQQGKQYSTAIVFSTKYVPPGFALHWGPWGQSEEQRYFGLYRELDPEVLAELMHGRVVWEQHRGAQTAAVLRFEHPALASLAPGDF